jgi:hypothetical protein
LKPVDVRGSYILTFAGYNAGRGSVKKWIERYGDPRDPKVDAAGPGFRSKPTCIAAPASVAGLHINAAPAPGRFAPLERTSLPTASTFPTNAIAQPCCRRRSVARRATSSRN